jgi:putative Ca2+/H+ antiporter (TMEM165/GDT1 family)
VPCNLIVEAKAWLDGTLSDVEFAHVWATLGSSFGLIAAAEFGDKSQLVCMTLAARHRHWPVFGGAVCAFAVLNFLAVAFGSAAAHWLPANIVALAVALLFGVFGIANLTAGESVEEEQAVIEKSGHGIFAATFLMIFLAEFGDKTQLAVAGLSAANPVFPVWVGATLALGASSALAIGMGKTLLKAVKPRTIHFASGLLFLIFAALAATRALPAELRETLTAYWDRIAAD